MFGSVDNVHLAKLIRVFISAFPLHKAALFPHPISSLYMLIRLITLPHLHAQSSHWINLHYSHYFS